MHKSTSTRKYDLEKEHKKLLEKLDIENFSLSRIPRPEESIDSPKKSESNKSKKNV